MSGRLEDMQRQIQAEIHRQVEERVHGLFSASREDLHVALAAIFRLYQDERERAKNALRRAEETEAIANLAMAEGLRAADALRGNFPRQCPHCRAAGDEPCEDVCLERAREYEELARECEERHWENMRDAYEDHYWENMRDAYGRAADG